MSLQIIIQDIKVFGKLIPNKKYQQNDPIQQQRRFRMTLGQNTFISQLCGFFISQNQLVFDESFSFFYDNRSIVLYVQIFQQHQDFNNQDIEQVLFAQFDLSDITTIGDRMQTTVFNFNDQAIGKLSILIEVFKKGAQFTEKVTSQILFETVKQQKKRQVKASAASKNIKNLMVNNALTNSLMTINYVQVRPEKQDPEIFNRQSFVMIRYGISIKACTKVTKILSKQNVTWSQYLQFMKNDDIKFQFFFMFYDDLGNLVCKAKGQIKYIVFDQTINNHTITLFDKRSNVYGNILVKFIQKQVEVVNIQNKIDKKLKDQDQNIMIAIDDFNKFKFESKNNNRILSQKLRQLQLKQLQQQQQKMKPMDPEQKKKRQQHGRFIQFLQKQVIKIQRQLKKRQIQQKKDERKVKYQSSQRAKQNKFNTSLTSTQFRQNLPKIDEIDQSHIIPQKLGEEF